LIIVFLSKSLQDAFGANAGTAYYTAKSFISTQVACWIEQAGLGLDVCTDGELAVVIAANFPAKKLNYMEITSQSQKLLLPLTKIL